MLQMIAICPHPPIIIPEIGKGELVRVEKTVEAMKEIAVDIKRLDPELLIFITPHGAVFQDAITISHPRKVRGSFDKFGVALSIEREFAAELSKEILKASQSIKGMVAELNDTDAQNYGIKLELDHGILVPLYYLDKAEVRCPIIPINMGMLPTSELYEFGTCLKKAIQKINKKVVIIVSGDLSHRLTPDAPAGFDPQGKVFDEIMVQAIGEGDVMRIINIEESLVHKAGECGLRPIIMGLGVLDGQKMETKIYSYEGPFGVGYLVASLRPGQEIATRFLLSKIKEREESKLTSIRNNESWPVKWARENLENYLHKGELLPKPAVKPKEFSGRKGVFVSIKKQGQLRGCIGTISPAKESIIEEIQANVLKAAFEDPRFEPIDKDELDELVYSVDILENPEKINGIDQLDPEIYGVIVKKGFRQGLLLPMLEGINNAEEQVAIAKQKAGIGTHEKVELERFKVTRYK
jgi:AmmeMemoRadiSam system protein A